MTFYRRNVGVGGEKTAKDYLLKNGFEIIETNFRCKLGEIDIIAKKGQTLHFIEVKTRSGDEKGMPYEAVNQRKLWHIKNVLEYYLLKNKIKNSKLSIDIVSILLDTNQQVENIRLYENITR